MPYEIFEYDLKILNLQRLLLANPQINLQSIYSIFGSFSDPQEFYLDPKLHGQLDNYPTLKFKQRSDGYFEISEFDDQPGGMIFPLTSFPDNSKFYEGVTHNSSIPPTLEELIQDIELVIKFYQLGQNLAYQIQSLQTFSAFLKVIKEKLTTIVGPPDFIKHKITCQFIKFLGSSDTHQAKLYFDLQLLEQIKISQIYIFSMNYIKDLPYSDKYREAIKDEFDKLNKQICDDDRKKLDKESILKNLSLAVENVNPIIEQQDYGPTYQRNASEIHTPKPAPTTYQSVWQNLEGIKKKRENISKRGTKVISSKDEIGDYFYQKKNPLQFPDSRKIEQTHVASLVKKREEAIETLYFSFIDKALEETQQACSGFSFEDALLALKIARYFGGVTNKLNERGDGYEKLELKEVNDFLNGSQNSGTWAKALTDKSINKEKFTQLKKFSALYQKHAGQYFKSARDSKTNIRLTFFPDRFIDKLISQGEQFVIQAKDKIGKTQKSREYV